MFKDKAEELRAFAFLKAKQEAFDKAKEELEEAKMRVVMRAGIDTLESGTYKLGDDTNKIVIEVKATYKVDEKAFARLTTVPETLFRTKHEVNATVWKNMSQEARSEMASVITTQISKPSVKLVIKETDEE